MAELKIKEETSELLTSEKHLADYFELVAEKTKDPVLAGHWVTGEFFETFE